jgi:hypothetical protein
VIAEIRNRRLGYAKTKPKQLAFAEARNRWPHLWSGRGHHGQEAAREEREWAEKGFLGGGTQQVGKLGTLLADYEEEREGERIRQLRRQRATEEFVPEEEDSDESEMSDQGGEESPEEELATFERRIQELFIYGMLEVSVANGRWACMTKCTGSGLRVGGLERAVRRRGRERAGAVLRGGRVTGGVTRSILFWALFGEWIS